ncbi:MAG: VCBS repeat-containing protein, partial [Alphaproteobacteria bacterium]
MILSISKKKKYCTFILLAGLLASCAHESKINPVVQVTSENEAPKKFEMGPETPSSFFIDRTIDYGLADVQAVHLYAVDVDQDGHTDLVTLDDFLASPKFYLFTPTTKKFVLAPNPFDSLVRGSFMNFVDLNNDGIYDLIIGLLNQKTEMTQYPARVFKGEIFNNKLHYKEQAPLPTSLLPTASIAAVDFNMDGKLDLYLANWFSYNDKSPRPVPDLLLKGNGFDFSDSSLSLRSEYDYNKNDKIYSNATPTFGASVCDVDKNGFPDILTSNSNGYYNKLWLNLDGQNFVNYGVESEYAADAEGAQGVLGGGNSFFSLCGDYNNDGLVDIVVGNLSRDNDPETRDRSSVLSGSSKNFPPKFIRSEFLQSNSSPNWSQGDRRGVWIDYNLDGLNDLIIYNSGFPPD